MPISSLIYDKFSKENSNSISNHVDLLELKKLSLIPTNQNCNSFIQILPCVRRLFIIFDSIFPTIYRIHCSDSLRILNEILCLIEEYLHIAPLTTISSQELLDNENLFDHFLSQLRRPSIMRQRSIPSIKTDLHCFGQGIQANHILNQLHQTNLFCFELTTRNSSLPIQILILDPDNNSVSNEIQYINTYNQGHTKLYSCSYTPQTKAGIYKISFRPVTNREYSVFIHPSILSNDIDLLISSSSEVPEYDLEGDGYSTKIIVNSIARFRLRLKSSSIIDAFSVSIIDPFGHQIVVQHRILSSDLLELTYQPMSIGEYQLKVSFRNQIHRQWIIDVINDESNSLSKLRPFGPGLSRAIVGYPTEFYVDLNQTNMNNNSNIHFRLEPSYQAEVDYEQQLATVRYIPLHDGDCPIHILDNDQEILNSPFIAHVKTTNIEQEKPRIRVVGLGKKIILHRSVEFQVFIDNPLEDFADSLHVDILTENDDNDQSPTVSIRRRHRSSYICSFQPNIFGKYIISIDYAGIVAEQNPFICQTIQEKDIFLTGPAINNQCLSLNQPTHFCFTLKDFLSSNFLETNATYESGYSSNDEISMKSSSSTKDDEPNYQITITDSHGNIKPNVVINENSHSKSDNNYVRVDFTPDEKILYINISCTW